MWNLSRGMQFPKYVVRNCVLLQFFFLLKVLSASVCWQRSWHIALCFVVNPEHPSTVELVNVPGVCAMRDGTGEDRKDRFEGTSRTGLLFYPDIMHHTEVAKGFFCLFMKIESQLK